jgi:hypothetical protein
MNLIIFGTGEYEYWTNLEYVQKHNDRFVRYVLEQWPGAQVKKQEPTDAWTAAEIRDKLAVWLKSCGKDDDLVLLWSGHGTGVDDQHRLITYESPLPGQDDILTQNAIMTAELAGYLLACPAKRIVVLLNTCWSGDGGQELAGAIGGPVFDSLSQEQTRSMAIISSARREEALDGAFVSSMLTVLRSAVPPPGLAAEYRWPESTRTLSPDSLCAAVNVLLRDSDHQAQIQTPYGIVGGFFRRANAAPEAPELPPRLVARLERRFPGRLSAHDGPWNAARVRVAIRQHSVGEPGDELAYRLGKLALGLAALEFIERWLGPDAGLAHHLAPAWQAVLWPIHRIPHPEERFGYIEQVVLHAGDQQVIEFIARVIQDAADDPCDDRLYEWAQREMHVDRKVVDDALKKLSSSSAQNRLIINFGMAIADDGEQDALPESVLAWIYRPDGTCPATQEYPFEPPYDVAEMVGRLVHWARNEDGDVNQVDVALPVSLFRSSTRPEAARIKLRRQFSKPVAESSGVVIRWAERISDKIARAEGLAQGYKISMTSALDWIERDTYASTEDLYDKLTRLSRAIAFSYEPDDLEVFYAAGYASPYVLWVDREIGDVAEIQHEMARSWRDLPGRLREAYRSREPDAICGVHAVWDDPDWLENIVPKLPDPNHRLSF